jgi:hypothetical protein
MHWKCSEWSSVDSTIQCNFTCLLLSLSTWEITTVPLSTVLRSCTMFPSKQCRSGT